MEPNERNISNYKANADILKGCTFNVTMQLRINTDFLFTILSVLEDEEYNLEKRKMKLFSYIVTHDTGFAPNPFWGYCTLACCKPAIRRTANVGDWIVGLSSKAKGHKIIYAMQVEDILSFKEYYRDSRFAAKIPVRNTGKLKNERGDNIYKHISDENFRQLPSEHSNGKKENPKSKKRDLKGKNVLISKRFHYFGIKAINLPKELRGLKVGIGHKNRFSEDVIKKFRNFIAKQSKGRCALPTMWDKGGHSCKAGNSCGSS